MFRRKSTAEVEGETCPYCEFVNKVGAITCVQCYYELNKAPRDQGEPISPEVSNSIFDELMSDEDDSWEEGEALDVVLNLDQDPLEVEQYAVTDFESEEPEKIGFMESSSPEMHDTVSHAPVDVTAEDVGEKIKDVPKLEFKKVDPFAEVPEPVHQGKGAVFSPATPSKVDDDLLGHVGGSELPSLPPDDLYENKIDLTVKKAPAPTPAVVLPDLPDIPDMSMVGHDQALSSDENQPTANVNTIEESSPEDTPNPPEISEEIPAPEIAQSTEGTSEIVESPEISVPSPEITNNRIWPWAEADAWDPRQVHREVVSALEQVKSGKHDEAAHTIDTLGPHLTDENVDLIYHIGMVLKQLNRVEEVKAMLELANSAMPGNEHVASAMAHLGV